VTVLKVKDVVIGQDKITITAEANIGMVVITPDGETKKSLRFTGRDSTWVKIKADEATFTVLRPHPKLDNEAWTEMSVNAAKALKAGKPIGRIGFYRPEITIRKNRIHAITGRAYIYPQRASAEANRNKERDDAVKEDAEAKSASRQTIVEPSQFGHAPLSQQMEYIALIHNNTDSMPTSD
jgi:hypothetical protein